MEKKPPYKSKTIWVNMIMALISFFPVVKEHFTADQVVIFLSLLNIILRLVSKDKIGLDP